MKDSIMDFFSNKGGQSYCYLADDFSKISLPDIVIKSPEGLMNASQIFNWIDELKKKPKAFATTSLFLIRELFLRKANVVYIYIKEDGTYVRSEDIDSLGQLEILQRELAQSDRYLKQCD